MADAVNAIEADAVDTIDAHLCRYFDIVREYVSEADEMRKQAAHLIERAARLEAEADSLLTRVDTARDIASNPYPARGGSAADDLAIVDTLSSSANAPMSGGGSSKDYIIGRVYDVKFNASIRMYRELHPVPKDAPAICLRVYADKDRYDVGFSGHLDFVCRDGVWSNYAGRELPKVGGSYVYDGRFYINENGVMIKQGTEMLNYVRWVMWTVDVPDEPKPKHAHKKSRK